MRTVLEVEYNAVNSATDARMEAEHCGVEGAAEIDEQERARLT